MLTTLNQNFVLKLTIDQKPAIGKNGQTAYEPNTTHTPYIVFDNHHDAPRGFGIKVSKTKKIYLVQRRVGSKVLKAKIGNVSDFYSIDAARNKAREFINVAHSTGRNPNAVAREKSAYEITLGEAFAQYRLHLNGRPKPAKQNTITVFDKALDRLSCWVNTKIKDISAKDILNKFDSIASPHRTAAEQTFRWANVSTKYAIEMERHNAAAQQRQSTLNYNPFEILKTNKKYRGRAALEDSYKAKGIRNPLSTKDTLGFWLNAIVGRRHINRRGCDFLLLCTLWGTRKNEAADLKWRDQLSDEEAITSSWVDLEDRVVFFYDTKNRHDHSLPIADAAFEMLRQRKEDVKKSTSKNNYWVFPAKSKNSKTGHYTDMKSIIKYVCNDAGIKHRGAHDLRRTFGRIAEELTSYAVVKRLLNHQETSDATSRYTDVEWGRLVEAMQRIELHVLATAPMVYNLLLTPKYQPLNGSVDVETKNSS